jgi:hypothetical protein
VNGIGLLGLAQFAEDLDQAVIVLGELGPIAGLLRLVFPSVALVLRRLLVGRPCLVPLLELLMGFPQALPTHAQFTLVLRVVRELFGEFLLDVEGFLESLERLLWLPELALEEADAVVAAAQVRPAADDLRVLGGEPLQDGAGFLVGSEGLLEPAACRGDKGGYRGKKRR